MALLARIAKRSVSKHRASGWPVFDFATPAGGVVCFGATAGAECSSFRLTLAPGLVHGFLVGQLHEPSLLLTGDICVEGDLMSFLTVLPFIPVLSRAYQSVLTPGRVGSPRLGVLRAYRLPLDALRQALVLPRRVSSEVMEHRTLVAALILLGLHPICRRIEIQEIVRVLTVREVAQSELVWANLMVILAEVAQCDAVRPTLLAHSAHMPYQDRPELAS
jgi:hypothetical protein